MKKFIIFNLLLVLILQSCKNTAEVAVHRAQDVKYQSENGLVYALPRTVLNFQVEAIQVTVIPGPYHQYAEKYLGISGVPKAERTEWFITDIKIDSYNEIDPSQFFILEPSGKFNVDYEKLTSYGLILPVNSRLHTQSETEFLTRKEDQEDVVFKDLSVKKYVGEEQRTYYKRVRRDSLFAKIPVVKKEVVHKTFEDKAEEAAAFILQIREKRFELITGLADFYPDGGSMELTLNELNRIESEYLSLFIGKKLEQKYQTSFEYTPKETDINKPIIIFRFAEDKGILPVNDIRGRPVILEMEKVGITEGINHFIADKVNRDGMDYTDKLYYRIPDKAEISIADGSTDLAKDKLMIEQFGKVVLFPAKFLMDKETFIEFYQEEK